ncbi:MAG: nuclear transport factor 2 family protein [Alphaproteobacteria bacterium]|nr:nuclear transport factor 2 family protein [Alphaproteobacteria bacterium]
MRHFLKVAGVMLILALFTGNGMAKDLPSPPAAIKAAVADLVEAFEMRDAAGIRSLMTEDHRAISPNYGRAYTVSEQIDTLPDLVYEVTDISNETFSVLDNNAALLTARFRVKGSFRGKPLPQHIFVSQIWIRQNGQWKQKLYQETAIDP